MELMMAMWMDLMTAMLMAMRMTAPTQSASAIPRRPQLVLEMALRMELMMAMWMELMTAMLMAMWMELMMVTMMEQ
jgi:hypothetical protein